VIELPSGTVTFLFTDIEGSTQLLHELGDRYAEVLGDHRRLLRDEFARHRGVEVDTQGDAFFVAFANPSDALAAAAAGRDALGRGRVRVRMGLHTGEPRLTDEGYVGIDVHRAARICSAAHGGQIVLSERTTTLLDSRFEVRDLGLHRLKDLGRPEKLFQLGEEQFPPLRSLNATNLPAQPSPLVGRQRELDELLPLVRERRLVTLTGPGGTGKTRLAIQIAAEVIESFQDGVFWIPLAPLTDAALVNTAIAQTLGATDGAAQHIDEKRMLLLLDNLEQLLPAAPTLAELLARCPNLHILATSRAALSVSAEREYLVEPLPEVDAVTLFVDRAAQAEPKSAVAAICRRLDGLPLAIELAAARTRVLPPKDLLERLQKALPLLTSHRRDAPARQQTLRATIEWSYDLLAPTERMRFERLGVFAGSFTLEAGELVCDADLDAVEQLVEHSLLRRWESGRLGMLETIREFALERLDVSGEADEFNHRHADHFLALAERSVPDLGAGRWAEWVDRLAADDMNLRAALEWADRSARADLKLRLVVALRHFWEARGYTQEGSRRFDEVLDHPEATPEQQLIILAYAAGFAYARGDFDRTRALYAQRLTLVRERLALGREPNDQIRLVDTLRGLGSVELELGNLPRARELLEESVAAGKELPDEEARVRILAESEFGHLLLHEQDYDGAIKIFEDVLSFFLERGDTLTACNCLLNLGSAELRRGRLNEAAERLREGLSCARELGYPDGIVNCLAVLAAVAARQHLAQRAAKILGASDTLRDNLGYSLQHIERELRDEAETISRDQLGPEGFEAAAADGQALETERAVLYALGYDN